MATRPVMDDRYSAVAIAFHWTIALLVLVNLASGLGGDAVPALGALFPLHKAIGITVLLLTLGRIVWRLGHRSPPLPGSIPGWERAVAHATHWTLYGLLVLMPLSGWAMASNPERRRPLTWFGAFDLPYLPVSAAQAGMGYDVHGVLGWMMAALVLLHIAAALRHHLILHDPTLIRILPGAR